MNEHFTEKSRQQPGGTTQQCTHAHKQARAHDERTHILLRAHNERENDIHPPLHMEANANHPTIERAMHKHTRPFENRRTLSHVNNPVSEEREREREARAGGAALRDSAGHGQSREISETRELFERGDSRW